MFLNAILAQLSFEQLCFLMEHGNKIWELPASEVILFYVTMKFYEDFYMMLFFQAGTLMDFKSHLFAIRMIFFANQTRKDY